MNAAGVPGNAGMWSTFGFTPEQVQMREEAVLEDAGR